MPGSVTSSNRKRLRFFITTRTSTKCSSRHVHAAGTDCAGICRWRGSFGAARFDLVIDLHGGPRSSWLTWATRAPKRIGYDVVGRGWMYTTRVHRPRELRPRHSVQNQWDLLGPLGIDPPDPRRDPTEMLESAAAAAAVASRLTEAGIRTTQTLIVVHVSAGNPFRRWPTPAFVGTGGGSGRRRSGTPHRGHVWTIGRRSEAAHHRDGARATSRCAGAGGS